MKRPPSHLDLRGTRQVTTLEVVGQDVACLCDRALPVVGAELGCFIWRSRRACTKARVRCA